MSSNEWDALAQSMKLPDEGAGPEAALRQSLFTASKTLPDTKAKVLDLAKQTGIPADIADRNFEQITQRREVDGLPYDRIIKETPKLAEWLSNPDNAGVAKDDLAGMGRLEWGLTKLADYGRAAAAGAVQMTGSALSGLSKLADTFNRNMAMYAPENAAIRSMLSGEPPAAPPLPFTDGVRPPTPADQRGPWWSGPFNVLEAAGNQVQKGGKAIDVPAERKGFGTEVAAGVGQLVPLIAASMLGGPGASAAMFAATGADDMDKVITPEVATQHNKDLAVLAGAGIAVATGEIGLGLLLERVPFPVQNVIVKKIADVVTAGGIQAGQAFSQQLLNGVAQRVLINPATPILPNITEQLASAGATGALARLLLTSFIGVNLPSHFDERSKTMESVGKDIAESKVFQRAPDAVRDFIALATKDGPAENVGIPVDKFREYFQSRNVDPAQAAEAITVGGADKFNQAALTGVDLEIPFSDYATKIMTTDHAAELNKEVRFHPGEMNFNEMTAFVDAMKEKVTADGELSPEDKSAAAIHEDIVGQLQGLGYDPSAIEGYATMFQAFFGSGAGERAGAEGRGGLDVKAFFDKYGLKVSRPLPDVLKNIGTTETLDSMIDRVRAGDIPDQANLYGDSLVQFIKKNGGVQDAGGDLASREPDKGAKPFTRKLIQEKGLPLDTMRERAAEAGYLPTDSSISDFLDKIDGELRGAPVYTDAAATEAESNPQFVAAQGLNELKQYLDDKGVDLNALSNEQVKKILSDAAAVEQSAGGVEFSQAGPPDSEAFKRWFGNSKAVAIDGEPLILNHQTHNDFETFDRLHAVKQFGRSAENLDRIGIWFTDQKKMYGPKNIEVYLSIKHPLILRDGDTPFGRDVDGANDGWSQLEGMRRAAGGATALREELKGYGYDGVLLNETLLDGKKQDVWIAFEPEQVKAAKNDGTFDPISGNIYHQPAYHGSPHDFEKFSMDKIGTGEGAAAFGYGLYFAENPAVAKDYQRNLSATSQHVRLSIGGTEIPANTPERHGASLLAFNDAREIRAAAKRWLKEAESGDLGVADTARQAGLEPVEYWQRLLDFVQSHNRKQIKVEKGVLYTVHIADEHVGKMLDWDAPLKDQPEPVKQIVREELKKLGYLREGDNGPKVLTSAWKAYMQERAGMGDKDSGSTIYDMLATALGGKRTLAEGISGGYEVPFKNEKAASEHLNSRGVPGIKYLDEGSRGKKRGGTRNLVVFSDSIVEVTHKNGEPVTAAERKAYFQGDDEKLRRGQMRFGSDRQFNIDVLRNADLSTFIHEAGHFYLEVFGDIVDNLNETANPAGAPIVKYRAQADVIERSLPPVKDGYVRVWRGNKADEIGTATSFTNDLAGIALPFREAYKGDLSYVDVPADKLAEYESKAGAAPGAEFNLPAELAATATKVESRGELLTDAQRQMQADYATLLKHLGVDGRAQIGTEQHEQFARTVEAYMMEGKAPAVGLRGMFARFRSWLLNIYRSMKQLNVELTPEVRAVMDRLFASDKEIEQAQNEAELKPVFMTQRESGLDDAAWKAYQGTVQEAHDRSVAYLDQKLMKDLQRERAEWWKTERDKVREQVAADVYKQPEYIAIAAMKNGKLPNGEESPVSIKLDLNFIKEKYGRTSAITNTLRRMGVARLEGGVHPDVAAEAFGFESGEALVNAMINARPMKQLIEAEANDIMISRHGDLLLDGSLPDQAKQAIFGKHRDEVVREEMRAIRAKQRETAPFVSAEAASQEKERAYERRWLEAEKRLAVATAEGRKQSEIDSLKAEMTQIRKDQAAAKREGMAAMNRGIPSDQQVARAAGDMLARTSIKDVRPDRYWSGARKASRAAIDAVNKGDYYSALQLKSQELLNLELYRQANAVKDEFEKVRTDWLKMFRADSKIAVTRNMDYVAAARAIAATYLFPKKLGDVVESMRKLEAYDPDTYEVIADQVNAATRGGKSFKELTVEEFNGLRDIVAGLWTLAKRDHQILVDGKLVARHEAQDAMRAKMLEHPGGYSAVGNDETASRFDKAKLDLLSLKAQGRRTESWVTAMDGGPEGPFRTYIWNPVKEAINRYRLRKVDLFEQYKAIIAPIDKSLTNEKIAAPELGYTFSGRAELLGALLHSGNREDAMSNLSKLLRGRQSQGQPWGTMREDGSLDATKWDAMILRMQRDGTLTKADYDYAQGVWDLFESLKPDLQKSHKEVYGHYFKEVPATEIETPWGTYRGGYVPAKADPIMSPESAIRNEKQSMSESGNSYAFPSAGTGNTKSRVGVAMPLAMNLAFIPSHIDWALRFAELQPRVKDVSKMLFDREFRAAINDIDPKAAGDMLVPWLQRAATQRITSIGSNRVMDNFWSFVRANSGMQAVALSVNNGLQQLTGLFIANTKVPAPRLASALWEYIHSPARMANEIQERSEFMRTFENNRAVEIQKDINDILLNPSVFAKAGDFARKHAGIMAQFTQGIVNTTAWMGAYDQAISEGLGEKESVRRADSVIRETQGSFFPEDVSKMETGTPFMRALTMFSSYFNMQANLQTTEVGNALRSDRGLMGTAGRVASLYAIGFMMPAVVSQAIANELSGNWGDDDDGYLAEILKLFFGAQIHTAAAMVPGLGQVVNAGYNAAFTDSSYDDDIRLSPWISQIQSVIKDIAGWTHGKGDTKTTFKDALTIVGVLSRLPLGPLGKPLGFLMDLSSGKAQPQGPVDVTRGLITGRIPKK